MSKLPSIAVPVTRRSTKKGRTPPAMPPEPPVAAQARRQSGAPQAVGQHRFRIGQRLNHVVAGNGTGRSGTCSIVALLPPERGVLSYRIRNEVENFERVVVEADLFLPDLP